MHARGDMVAKPSGRSYKNVYVFRIDLREGRVCHVEEVTNPITWANLGIS